MQDRPTARELLKTVGDFLEHEVMPAVDGPLNYRSRVALNLVRILERESSLGEEALRNERSRLSGLVGETLSAGRNAQAEVLADEVLALNRRLVNEIESASDLTPERQAAIRRELLAIARDKLAICRPGYADYDGAGEGKHS